MRLTSPHAPSVEPMFLMTVLNTVFRFCFSTPCSWNVWRVVRRSEPLPYCGRGKTGWPRKCGCGCSSVTCPCKKSSRQGTLSSRLQKSPLQAPRSWAWPAAGSTGAPGAPAAVPRVCCRLRCPPAVDRLTRSASSSMTRYSWLVTQPEGCRVRIMNWYDLPAPNVRCSRLSCM